MKVNKKIILILIPLFLISIFSGCISNERKYYSHYEGLLLDVLPTSNNTLIPNCLVFYFSDKAILLNVPDFLPQARLYNDCIILKHKNVTLIYESVTLTYVYCYELEDKL